ncbi:MAG: DUF11 domain-containing protein, partial [Chloroflexi bacterium]
MGTSTAQNPTYVYTTPGTYLVTLTVSGPGGTATFTATVIVNAALPPPPPPASDADLQLSKNASVTNITTGSTFDYTLTVTNNGPLDATGVVISDTLPAQVRFVSSATCSAAGSAVTCNVGALNNGASSVHTVTV